MKRWLIVRRNEKADGSWKKPPASLDNFNANHEKIPPKEQAENLEERNAVKADFQTAG